MSNYTLTTWNDIRFTIDVYGGCNSKHLQWITDWGKSGPWGSGENWPVYSTSTSASALSVFSAVTPSRSRTPTQSYTFLVLVISSSESCWICSGLRSHRSRLSAQTGTGLPKTTSPEEGQVTGQEEDVKEEAQFIKMAALHSGRSPAINMWHCLQLGQGYESLLLSPIHAGNLLRPRPLTGIVTQMSQKKKRLINRFFYLETAVVMKEL